MVRDRECAWLDEFFAREDEPNPEVVALQKEHERTVITIMELTEAGVNLAEVLNTVRYRMAVRRG